MTKREAKTATDENNPTTAVTRTRRPLSGLEPADIATLLKLVGDAVTTGRKNDDVDDDQLSRLYALKGKLGKITAVRVEG